MWKSARVCQARTFWYSVSAHLSLFFLSLSLGIMYPRFVHILNYFFYLDSCSTIQRGRKTNFRGHLKILSSNVIFMPVYISIALNHFSSPSAWTKCISFHFQHLSLGEMVLIFWSFLCSRWAHVCATSTYLFAFKHFRSNRKIISEAIFWFDCVTLSDSSVCSELNVFQELKMSYTHTLSLSHSHTHMHM